jgi:hypothetical protein
VAEKQVVAVGQQLCDKVKQQLEDMGQVLELAADSGEAAAKAAAAAAAAAEALEAENAAAGQQQQQEQQQREQQVADGAAAAAQAQGAPQKQSAEDVDGDFAGMPLLQVSGYVMPFGWVQTALPQTLPPHGCLPPDGCLPADGCDGTCPPFCFHIFRSHLTTGSRLAVSLATLLCAGAHHGKEGEQEGCCGGGGCG